MINTKAQEVRNITIFVHGTHTQLLTKLFPKTLYIPNKLVKILDLNKYNYVKWLTESISSSDSFTYPLDNFYAFGWTGMLNSKERFRSSQNLYLELKQLINICEQQNVKARITIITHSHGGNIALNLAKIHGDDQNLHIHKLILMACPVIEETQHLIDHKIFKNVYSIYSKVDMFQVMSIQGLPNLKNNSVFSGRRFSKVDKLKQFAIHINGRPIWHIEFIFWKFPKLLPQIVSSFDNVVVNGEYHMNVHYKHNKIQKIDLDKLNF